MAKVNTLFRKVYLLAVVMMAANMFIGNEVKAMNIENNNNEDEGETKNLLRKGKIPNIYKRNEKKSLGKLIRKLPDNQNIYTFFAGLFFSIVNNYSKWWDYNPGGYLNPRIGCLGWRSKSFLYDIIQFEINLNLGRGAFWTILLLLNSSSMLNTAKGKDEAPSTGAGMPSPMTSKKQNLHRFKIVARSIEGFISIPLAIHIQGLDISIALDSILFGLVVNHFVFPQLSSPFFYDYNGIDDVIQGSSFSGDYNGIKDIKEKGKPIKIYNN